MRGVDHEPEEDFAEFYRTSVDVCLRAVYASVGDKALAEDLTAEAFARAYASWPKVSRHPAPRAWVVRTALNAHISWWRRRKREVAWDAGIDRAVGGEPALGLDPTILAVLRALPPRQRQVLALRIFLDLDTAATASALGIAPGTVAAHLSRATAALRGALASASGQESMQ